MSNFARTFSKSGYILHNDISYRHEAHQSFYHNSQLPTAYCFLATEAVDLLHSDQVDIRILIQLISVKCIVDLQKLFPMVHLMLFFQFFIKLYTIPVLVVFCQHSFIIYGRSCFSQSIKHLVK